MGVVCGWNSLRECRGVLGTSGRPPAGRSTRTISVTSAEKKVTTPTTVTATAAGAGGAGPGLGPGLGGGVTPAAGVAAGAEGGGPGPPPEGLAPPRRGGPGPGPGPGPGLGLEVAAGLDRWVDLALDLQLEVARRLGVAAAVKVQTETNEDFLFVCKNVVLFLNRFSC